MPLVTFAPSIAPSPGGSRTPEVTLYSAGFGDGYTQEAPAGINHIRQVVNLRWEVLAAPQVQELRAFFEGQGGYRPFWYQPHGYTAPLKWTCKKWSDSGSTPFSFSAELRQSFTLET